MLPPHAKRILDYFDAIDSAGGRANKTDFFKVAGNVTNRDRMTSYLIERKLVSETEQDGHKYYSKTEWGEGLHKLFKNHAYLGTLFEELGRSRLRPP